MMMTNPSLLLSPYAQDYESRRDYIVNLLTRVGFKIQFKPQGALFLFAELPENCKLSDVCLPFTLLVL